MSKALVAYFSASGVTARLAERLADAIDADITAIEPSQPYSRADLNWQDTKSRSSVEMNDRNCRPGIVRKNLDMSRYDEVFVGFPVWWYREPSVVDTFMETYDFQGKVIIPFATSGMSGIGDSGKNLQALVPGARVVAGQRFDANTLGHVLADWAIEWV